MNPDEATSPTSPEPLSGRTDTANGGFVDSSTAVLVVGTGIRTWSLAVAAGLIAGVIAWGIGEVAMTPDSGHARRRGNVDPLASEVGLRNAVVCFAALGAAMGLGLGSAGGLIRQSATRTALASVTGLTLGGLTGAGVARLLVPVYYEHLTGDDLTYSLIVHGATWGALGAVTGLAFGLGLGGSGRLLLSTALGGMMGAVLATVIYEFAGAILFPIAMTNQPVSVTWQTRLLARLLVTVLVATGVVLSAGSVGKGPKTSADGH